MSMKTKINDLTYEIEEMVSTIRQIIFFCKDISETTKFKIPKNISEKNFIRLFKSSETTPNLLYIKNLLTRNVEDNILLRNDFLWLKSFIKADKDLTKESDIMEYVKDIEASSLSCMSNSKDEYAYVRYNTKEYNERVLSIEFDGVKETLISENDMQSLVAYLCFIMSTLEDMILYIKSMLSIEDLLTIYKTDGMMSYEIKDKLLNLLIGTDIKNLHSEDLLQYTIENYYQKMCTNITDEGVENIVYNMKKYVESFEEAMRKNINDAKYIINKLGEFINHITMQFINTENVDEYFGK